MAGEDPQVQDAPAQALTIDPPKKPEPIPIWKRLLFTNFVGYDPGVAQVQKYNRDTADFYRQQQAAQWFQKQAEDQQATSETYAQKYLEQNAQLSKVGTDLAIASRIPGISPIELQEKQAQYESMKQMTDFSKAMAMKYAGTSQQYQQWMPVMISKMQPPPQAMQPPRGPGMSYEQPSYASPNDPGMGKVPQAAPTGQDQAPAEPQITQEQAQADLSRPTGLSALNDELPTLFGIPSGQVGASSIVVPAKTTDEFNQYTQRMDDWAKNHNGLRPPVTFIDLEKTFKFGIQEADRLTTSENVLRGRAAMYGVAEQTPKDTQKMLDALRSPMATGEDAKNLLTVMQASEDKRVDLIRSFRHGIEDQANQIAKEKARYEKATEAYQQVIMNRALEAAGIPSGVVASPKQEPTATSDQDFVDKMISDNSWSKPLTPEQRATISAALDARHQH